ncbi:hypothetical protein FE257_003850 [Aspergillus nanangensis]|uniref:Uncharacterized protein n=1 Tax=Aspergillus nanangensis TaxID=2582783 RepID=A0AAD4CBJ5_ASPNN|nr:hypothetical protein FE257_003850 [Aspergillus nanangensis]
MSFPTQAQDGPAYNTRSRSRLVASSAPSVSEAFPDSSSEAASQDPRGRSLEQEDADATPRASQVTLPTTEPNPLPLSTSSGTAPQADSSNAREKTLQQREEAVRQRERDVRELQKQQDQQSGHHDKELREFHDRIISLITASQADSLNEQDNAPQQQDDALGQLNAFKQLAKRVQEVQKQQDNQSREFQRQMELAEVIKQQDTNSGNAESDESLRSRKAA